jgi:(p)ppGpp synthase/HD superfamily hydrolase
MTSTFGLVERAEDFARRHHGDQLDAQGQPYCDAHLAPVAAVLAPYDEILEACGWLHDVVEDTNVTFWLLNRTFGSLITETVRSVTKLPEETYDDMIARAAAHPLGRLVKLADNYVNRNRMDGLRAINPAKADSLTVRYERAHGRLLGALLDEALPGLGRTAT